MASRSTARGEGIAPLLLWKDGSVLSDARHRTRWRRPRRAASQQPTTHVVSGRVLSTLDVQVGAGFVSASFSGVSDYYLRCSMSMARTCPMRSKRVNFECATSTEERTNCSRTNINVGIDMMWHDPASASSTSVSSYANTTSLNGSKTLSKVGAKTRHGPHHEAQTSFSGTLAEETNPSKISAADSCVATIRPSVMRSTHLHHNVNRYSHSFVGVHWPLNTLSNNDVHTNTRDVANDVLGSEEHVRVLGSAVAVHQIGQVVSDHEERSARCHSCSHVPMELCPERRGHVHVRQENEIVRRTPRHPRGHVRLDPLNHDAAFSRDPPRLGQSLYGEVDTGDSPSLRGEPYGVASLTAGNIEGASGCKTHNLFDEGSIGFSSPDQILSAVPLVPRSCVQDGPPDP